MKNITLLTLFVGACAFITSAYAEVSGNIGVTSNYLWRGMAQNNDKAAISGGLDYAGEGFYAGTWVSSLDGGSEVDIYAGTEISGIDVGIIRYMYPEAGTGYFTEVYAGGSVSVFDLFLAVNTGNDDLYYAASYSFDLTETVSATFTYGITDPDEGSEKEHMQLDVAYEDFTLTLSELEGEDMKFVASYGWAF
jgi:uncharacterized protein (TIGR02001 family)